MAEEALDQAGRPGRVGLLENPEVGRQALAGRWQGKEGQGKEGQGKPAQVREVRGPRGHPELPDRAAAPAAPAAQAWGPRAEQRAAGWQEARRAELAARGRELAELAKLASPERDRQAQGKREQGKRAPAPQAGRRALQVRVEQRERQSLAGSSRAR